MLLSSGCRSGVLLLVLVQGGQHGGLGGGVGSLEEGRSSWVHAGRHAHLRLLRLLRLPCLLLLMSGQRCSMLLLQHSQLLLPLLQVRSHGWRMLCLLRLLCLLWHVLLAGLGRGWAVAAGWTTHDQGWGRAHSRQLLRRLGNLRQAASSSRRQLRWSGGGRQGRGQLQVDVAGWGGRAERLLCCLLCLLRLLWHLRQRLGDRVHGVLCRSHRLQARQLCRLPILLRYALLQVGR